MTARGFVHACMQSPVHAAGCARFRLFTLAVQLFTLVVQAGFQFEHPDGVAAKALELNVLVWSVRAVWWWCGQSPV